MTETFADTIVRFRSLVADQVAGYRRLLRATRDGNGALARADHERFDRVLVEQIETLRDLKRLEAERRDMIRDVGLGAPDQELAAMSEELRALAVEVSRASRSTRLVLERNGELVEARLAIHRRAGTLSGATRPGVDRIA